MRRTKLLSLLTVSVIVSVLAAMAVAPAVADGSSYKGGDGPSYKDKYGYEGKYCDKCPCGYDGGMHDKCPYGYDKGKYDKDKYGYDRDGKIIKDGRIPRERMSYEGMHPEPKDIYMSVTHDGMSGDTASFSINSIGMAGHDGIAAFANFNTPLKGKYNASKHQGTISLDNFLPATMTIDYVGSISMPTGNMTAIVGMHGVKTMFDEKGNKISKFSSVSVFFPDGSMKFFKLETPVKMVYMKDSKALVISTNPEFVKRMGSVFMGSSAPYMGQGPSSISMSSMMPEEVSTQADQGGYETTGYGESPA